METYKIIYLYNSENKLLVPEEIQVKFEIYYIDLSKKFNELKPTLYCCYEIEDFYNKIANELKKQDINAILIDFNLNGYDPFVLTHHIRLTFKEKNIPIIILHDSCIDIYKYSDLNSLKTFSLKAAKFDLYDNLFKINKFKKEQIRLLELISDLKNNFNFNIYIEYLNIPKPETTSRHQIANEWGAYRLAAEAGFDLDYKVPQTLYFKFLKAKYGDPNKKKVKETIFSQKLKVLLIDDNYDKGWQEVLRKILPAKVDVRDTAFKVAINKKLNFTYEQISNYDLIFLDLYLPQNEAQNDTSTIDIGIDLLQTIKQINPAIPVIVFTASNKAWNLKKVVEAGADGFFVKEAPENAHIKNFSIDNYRDFRNTVRNAYKKGKLLKPYWNTIKIIENNYLPQIVNTKNKKIKSRIEERLMMFFGLLKRGFEQTKFNEQFYFSDYELAYMTLWSVLNEVQEAYYEKYFPNENLLIQIKGKTYDKHPNGKNIIPIPDWNRKIKGQTEYLIKHKFTIKRDDKGNLVIKNKNYYKLVSEEHSVYLKLIEEKPYYKLAVNKRESIWKELANQIAFLILQKNELKNDSRKEEFLILLKELNDTRNSLYLTHGETYKFYSKTEKEKREKKEIDITPLKGGKIYKLFRLVAFLLAGEKSINVDDILNRLPTN